MPAGTLVQAYPFAELRQDALVNARRFVALGIKPGDRIAMVAETGADFAACFFGAVYAGSWPVPLPLPTSFGGRDAYVDQLVVQLKSCDPALLLYPQELSEFCGEQPRQGGHRLAKLGIARQRPAGRDRPPDRATGRYRLPSIFERIDALPARRRGYPPRASRQPSRHGIGLKIAEGDRCISWLPWYHDMGLVGCFLSPMSLQFSVDYLKTEDFARRPLAWLDMITRNPGNSVSYSPTFGYDICSRRMSSQTRAEDRFDLSRWRIAGNGADMIRPDVMQAFVDCFAPAGFRASAFCPSYGLAEATLAVSLMPPGEGIRLELVEENELSGGQRRGRRGPAEALPRGRQLRPPRDRHGGRDPRR